MMNAGKLFALLSDSRAEYSEIVAEFEKLTQKAGMSRGLDALDKLRRAYDAMRWSAPCR